LPNTNLNYKSSLKILYQRKIIIDYLKSLDAYAMYTMIKRKINWILGQLRLFFGLFHSKKGYKCYDSNTKIFYISKNIKFQENESYFKEKLNECKGLEPLNTILFFKEPETNELEINEEIAHIEQETENKPLEEIFQDNE
jgi:hypothetical protein